MNNLLVQNISPKKLVPSLKFPVELSGSNWYIAASAGGQKQQVITAVAQLLFHSFVKQLL